MEVSDRIQQYVQRFPKRMQSEVLTFVENLLSKSEQEEAHHDERDWPGMSLTFAMRGMEYEDTPQYSETDLKGVVRVKRPGQIVLFRFPYANQSEGKLRLALLLGPTGEIGRDRLELIKRRFYTSRPISF